MHDDQMPSAPETSTAEDADTLKRQLLVYQRGLSRLLEKIGIPQQTSGQHHNTRYAMLWKDPERLLLLYLRKNGPLTTRDLQRKTVFRLSPPILRTALDRLQDAGAIVQKPQGRTSVWVPVQSRNPEDHLSGESDQGTSTTGILEQNPAPADLSASPVEVATRKTQ